MVTEKKTGEFGQTVIDKFNAWCDERIRGYQDIPNMDDRRTARIEALRSARTNLERIVQEVCLEVRR